MSAALVFLDVVQSNSWPKHRPFNSILNDRSELPCPTNDDLCDLTPIPDPDDRSSVALGQEKRRHLPIIFARVSRTDPSNWAPG